MMTSSRPRGDVGGSFASRRGHGPQLSISDPSHHVTEAIGTLYGDEDDYSNDHRPLSFLQSPYQEHGQKHSETNHSSDDTRRPLIRSTSDKSPAAMSVNGHHPIKKSQTLPARIPSQRNHSFENGPRSPLSPTLSLRDVQNDSAQFPLTRIDNASDIAQELSNLQALRRMSMDVGNTSDPDLPPFSSMSYMAMPSIAPKGGDDEGDPERLLWVPARVHPELAPSEFKNFLENRVQSIKRRSGESFLSVDPVDRGTTGGLRRKKSMLSRQIDNSGGRGADGYVDGSERLDRKRSSSGGTPELSLDELVKDPTGAVQKLARESQRPGDTGPESNADDMPILPVGPGMGLRRSTRTQYRKGGSLRSGDRLPFSKRVAGRHGHTDSDSSETAPLTPLEAPVGHTLQRVQSEPVAENFSRPNRSVRRQQKFTQENISVGTRGDGMMQDPHDPTSPTRAFHEQLPLRTSSVSSDSRIPPVPHIVETPAPEDDADQQGGQAGRVFPQRSSSQKATQHISSEQPLEPPARSSKRPSVGRPLQTAPPALQQPQQSQPQPQAPPVSPPQPQPQPQQQVQQQQHHVKQPSIPQGQTLNDMASHPSPLPGGGATRTDSLTFIPTFSAEDRKLEKKKKEKDDDSSSTKSTGWPKWLKSSSEDKEKKKREEEKKRSKGFVEKAQDNARLDVLQNSIEGTATKGRDSLLLDRDNVDSKLAEERKKESNRKADPKKEKEGGLFSGLFGGGKKKSEKESSSKKGHHLRVSEDPPFRPLKPDVDYHWTRFPLLEERAIYRMAHIKLANPRRSLLSQVLLSNFMYNYLAIVQAMHPQMQVPQSPQQRRLEEERRRKEQEEQYLAQQQMQQEQEAMEQDAIDRYNYEYHRGDNQYGDNQYGDNNAHDEVDYVDDAQIYEYEHGGDNDEMRGNGYNGNDGYTDQQRKDYYQDGYGRDNGEESRGREGRDGRDGGRNDMW